jgi:hypothetical protein
MAARFLGVTGLWDLELRLEPSPDDRVGGVIVDLHVMGLLHSLPQGLVKANAGGCRSACSKAASTARGSETDFLHIQQSSQAACLIDAKPVADGMAMNAQELGDIPARVGRNRCRHISGLVVKASSCLRALMKYALLLLINLSAFTALDNVRVWRSRSDLSYLSVLACTWHRGDDS